MELWVCGEWFAPPPPPMPECAQGVGQSRRSRLDSVFGLDTGVVGTRLASSAGHCINVEAVKDKKNTRDV